MGKQTMGTPSTALQHRTDNKLYRLQTGQSPVVRPALHNTYAMDSFPNGTNAVVAVISYTGYDMEDAMILNKSAHERGFAYGTVYKSQTVDLKDMKGATKTGSPSLHFGIGRDVPSGEGKSHSCFELIDLDGLPFIGVRLKPGDIIAAYMDDTTGRTKFVKYKGDEIAYVDQVRLLGMYPYLSLSIIYITDLVHQGATLVTVNYKKSTSHCASPVRLSSETNSPRGMDRRVFARKSGLPLTCLSPRAACNPT